MPKNEVVKALTLVREAGILLSKAKTDASRESDDEWVGRIIESLGAAEAMVQELESILVLRPL